MPHTRRETKRGGADTPVPVLLLATSRIPRSRSTPGEIIASASQRTSSVQLTIDGREEPMELLAAHGTWVTAAQRGILRLLAERRAITSTDAGRIVHAHRQPPCERCLRGDCGFTSTDGTHALKRLQARGLAERIAPGRWMSPADAVPEPAQPAPATASNDPGVRGPKGARVGDIVVAERSRWRVESIDPDHREVTCRLIGGSGVYRRFRARRIAKVERGAT